MDDTRHTCRHCREKPACRPRGLCKRCYALKAVRSLFPCDKPRNARRGLGLTAPRKLATTPLRAHDQEQRTRVLARRLAQGQHLWTPGDTRRIAEMEALPIDPGAWVRCRDCGTPQAGTILRREDGHLLCQGCAGRRRDAEAHVQRLYDQEQNHAGCGPVG